MPGRLAGEVDLRPSPLLRGRGGPYEFNLRIYIQEGSTSMRLFGPNKPLPRGKEAQDGGYQGSIPLESPRGLLLLTLFEEGDGPA